LLFVPLIPGQEEWTLETKKGGPISFRVAAVGWGKEKVAQLKDIGAKIREVAPFSGDRQGKAEDPQKEGRYPPPERRIRVDEEEGALDAFVTRDIDYWEGGGSIEVPITSSGKKRG